MYLCDIYLQNFRNYDEAFVEFCPGVNKILGSNAQGKTNLLEAIYLLITGQSFRTSSLRDLIKDQASHFYIEAHFIKNGIKQKMRLHYDGQRRRLAHNSTEYSSFSGLVGLVPGIIWSPEDQELVKGSPGVRRRFLDYQIAQFDPLYVHHLIRYNKAMKQRNCLLKAKKISGIEGWEQSMALAGEYVVTQRRCVVDKLLPYTQKIQQSLSDDDLSFEYKTPAPEKSLRDYYMSEYSRMRQREMAYGNTLVGPHRDDLYLTMKNRNARHFASEGQQRCCIAAVRLAQWYHLKQEVFCNPLMIIDDVGISLDSSRSALLGEQINQLGQVFLSAPRELDWDERKNSKTMVIKEGNIYT